MSKIVVTSEVVELQHWIRPIPAVVCRWDGERATAILDMGQIRVYDAMSSTWTLRHPMTPAQERRVRRLLAKGKS